MKLKAITGVLTAAHFVMSFVFTSLSFSIDRLELFSHPANRIDDMIAYRLDVCARAIAHINYDQNATMNLFLFMNLKIHV